MQPASHGAAGTGGSWFGHGLSRLDGKCLLLEPCSQAVALKAALAAEFRLEPVGKLQGSVQLTGLLRSKSS